MPHYTYECQHCGGKASIRRLISELEDPLGPSLCCGAGLSRVFDPNSNIVVPTHFKAVRPGGVEGGYSWSDFHDESERELARTKVDSAGNRIEYVPISEVRSRPQPAPVSPGPSIGQVYNEVRQMPEGKIRELAAAKPAPRAAPEE